jgi:putative glutathione S-transferase
VIIIFSWLRRLYWQNDAFQSTTNFDHIKTHYYWSHPHVCFGFAL